MHNMFNITTKLHLLYLIYSTKNKAYITTQFDERFINDAVIKNNLLT